MRHVLDGRDGKYRCALCSPHAREHLVCHPRLHQKSQARRRRTRSMRGCCANAASSASKTPPASAGPRLTIRADTRRTTRWRACIRCRRHSRRSRNASTHMSRTFARTLDFDLAGRKLVMTDCWVNVMTRQVVHGLHLHPLATLERHVLRAYAARLLGTEIRRSAARSLHGLAAAQGARAPRQPGVGDGAGGAGQPGVVRELAAARSGAESHRGRAHLDQLQLFLVLSRRQDNRAAETCSTRASTPRKSVSADEDEPGERAVQVRIVVDVVARVSSTPTSV